MLIKRVYINYDMLPSNNEEFLSIKVVSQSTARAIILIAELIFATKSPWEDPTMHSFVQGIDNITYFIDRKSYDDHYSILTIFN
ncbi:MAG TPA: DUF763 domain-containing protein [Candidatus Nitrosocosmicus sp.]|nr:DUF763 domain-containing protein [Candidatus Nitrosocosmicus sp.]